jgi:hypothetical protein
MIEENLTPLTAAEQAHYRSLAARGETPSLDIIRRFIATIRKTFSASPIKVEKASKTRNAKPKPDESQIDFF